MPNEQMLVAVHAIVVCDPDVEAVATGAWKDDGTPVMRRSTRKILPGAMFEVTALRGGQTEAEELVESGAARRLNRIERRLNEGDHSDFDRIS